MTRLVAKERAKTKDTGNVQWGMRGLKGTVIIHVRARDAKLQQCRSAVKSFVPMYDRRTAPAQRPSGRIYDSFRKFTGNSSEVVVVVVVVVAVVVVTVVVAVVVV